ncbi:MAG: hypothetical protein GY833_12685 [Aestuariibacter sp.]|nr:hypothetical protein [Aestuariibacter sp.]
MDATTLRFRFQLPNEVNATVIQNTLDSSSVVNYEHTYHVFNYSSRAIRPDIISTADQRIHVNYEHGKMTDELSIVYTIINARMEEELELFGGQVIEAHSKACFEFKYVKADDGQSYELVSIHRGIDEVFTTRDGGEIPKDVTQCVFDFRTSLPIVIRHLHVPMVSSKFGQTSDIQIPEEAL